MRSPLRNRHTFSSSSLALSRGVYVFLADEPCGKAVDVIAGLSVETAVETARLRCKAGKSRLGGRLPAVRLQKGK